MIESQERCAMCGKEAELFFKSRYRSVEFGDIIGLCRACYTQAEQSGDRDLFVYHKILNPPSYYPHRQ